MAGYKAYIEDKSPLLEEEIVLPTQETQHLTKSLRAKAGTSVIVFNHLREAWIGQLTSSNTIKILEKCLYPAPKAQITLAQALTKGKTFEIIIQKATELGISQIIPLITEHTEVKISEKKEEKRLKKWQTIIIEACKQSGNFYIPQITAPQKYKDYIQSIKQNSLKLIASLEKDSAPLKTIFTRNNDIHWLIGPEGDFSPTEYELAKEAGFQAVRLGNHVLRSETAALYALSATDALL